MQRESELIDKAKAGSVSAFTLLVEGYRERLLRFLLTRCPSYADAEDALQDTLINAYRYLYSYDPRWRFSTWLYRIAIRNALKHAAGDTVEFTETPDDSDGPLEQCIDEEARQNVWVRAKRVLNDDVYTAMWLRYVEDMSVNDVASVLKRSTSWTKVNLMRGRQALAAELGDTSAGNNEERSYGEV
ncbi:MAG: sigma-70 family RNA polymerase sigma factor [Woeseiaceae bacterium]|nr:sigma-70 family RNA polymerase sigma factor [Woeseiaceae bacterium]